MITGKSLSQEGGNKSTNYQGQTINVNNGISYSDAKEIALDIFNANFLRLSESAAKTAKERAEELIDNFLKKVSETDINLIDSVKDPDMQYAIYTAQKEYARSGEQDIEEILINILVERASEKKQSLKKISLNESLLVAPKLTEHHLNILSLIFLIKESQNEDVINAETMLMYLNSHIIPFVESCSKTLATYKHLLFTGCCSSSSGLIQNRLSAYFLHNYRAVFSKGFTLDRVTESFGSGIDLSIYLKQCLNNSDLYQFKALKSSALESELEGKFDEDTIERINNLFVNTTMDMDEIDEYLMQLNPGIEKLIDRWSTTSICSIELTSVGIILAIMNIKRKIGINIDSSIFLSD